MPKCLYTPVPRGKLTIEDSIAGAVRLPSDDGKDRFAIGSCRITCRYWTTGGDVVSRQILGCANAIRTGRLACDDSDAAMRRVFLAKTEIGMVGPDDELDTLATAIAKRFGGVLISETDAKLFV